MASTTTASGLIIEELKVGTGAEAAAGQHVSVHYTGWLTDGTKFDSSKDRGDPFEFPLGAGHVIRGWDEGVQGMKVGGSRKRSKMYCMTSSRRWCSKSNCSAPNKPALKEA